MNTFHKTLLLAALVATPFAAAQAQSSRAAHEAWLKAQQIDIKPTLKITETEIPAGSSPSTPSVNPGSSMPAGQIPSTSTPSTPAPSMPMPSGHQSAPAPGAAAPANSSAPGMPSYGSPYGTGQPAK